MPHLLIVYGIVFLALFFDFLNGMHDAANEIATVVSTRVLSPRNAVLWAACFHMVAAFGFGVHVATAIGKGLINPSVMDNAVILGALVGGSLWNYFTITLGLPVSSSHSLIGGLVGAAVAKAGWGCLLYKGIGLVVAFMILSPIAGLLLGYILMISSFWIFRKTSPHRVDSFSRVGQLASSAFLSLSHGLNDAQKTMGVIAILLFSNGFLGAHFYIPKWVILSCYFIMSLGTLAGGWKVVHTVGQRVTKLRPLSGMCADLGSGTVMFVCGMAGIPISTTHLVNGTLMGVGATQRLSAVRWGVVHEIIVAWFLTIPCAAAVAAISYHIFAHFI